MKLAFQGNNGNGHKPLVTSDNLKFACQELGIPDDKHTLRRTARAFDLYHSNKVEHVNDHTFRIASQYDRQRPYQVKLHEGATKPYGYCSCADWQNNSGDHDYPDVNFWCKHMISAAIWLHRHNGNGTKRIENECGTNEAQELQNKLNGQLTKSENSGNGDAKSPSQPMPLYLSDPFQEAESLDIAQIEHKANGEMAWKLSNGEYVISYTGIMSLAEKHDITFEEAVHSDTSTVIAKGRCGRNERVSGKPINGNEVTALELAKRNAARQLLPLAEIKAIEKKVQLESDFDWQKAQAKCVELVGTKANVDIIINDLVNWGKLRQAAPSEYTRTEWLLIHEWCKRDAQIERDPKCTNNWSRNSAVFMDRCKEAIQKVRAEKEIDVNELPPAPMVSSSDNGKRTIQMDKNLNTWLIEADGTKTEISCREICERFNDGSIITRLRTGIDSGADISTVELDD